MDRRRCARYRADLAVITYENGVAHRGRSLDLSCGGALLQRSIDRAPPMLQRLELQLDGRHTVRGMARTVWSKRGTCAVRFLGLSDVDRLEIAEHLDRAALARRAALPR
jgi:hypothetical protein